MALRPSSPRSRRRTAGLGIGLILGALGTAYASTEVGSESAYAAALGTLSLVTGEGSSLTTGSTDAAVITFKASAPCPAEAVRYKISITGAGFPDGTNAVGASTIPDVTQAIVAPQTLGTFGELAASAGAPLPLTGTANIDLICIKGFSESVGDFPGQLTFTPSTGQNSTFSTAGGAAASPTPEATPSPSPSTEASPSPSAEATPSPSPSPSTAADATPSPSPSAEATPSPSPDASASPSPSSTPDPQVGGETIDVDTNLPATGAGMAGPMLLLAVMLLVSGTLLILLSTAAVPATEQRT